MVVRPSDWFLVGLAVDPTPGDAFGIRNLAGKYGEIAQTAGEASSGVRHARSSGAASAWVGDAGDIFRDRSERMPGELAKANDSYELVAEALRTWAAAVDDTQAQADRGLQQAREAHHDLSAAQAALHSAEWSWTTAHAQQLTYQTLKKAYSIVPPPPGVKMPTDYQLRSVDRSAQQAQASMVSAKHAIADADARLAAARALVMEAKQRRDDAERSVVHQIAQAGDHAVKPSSIWEAITSSAAWSALVTIATVVLTIVSIVAIFVGGPLVWALIIAATVVLLADALMRAGQGQDVTMTIVLLLVGLIPGGRALTSVAKIAEVFRSGANVAKGVGLVGVHILSVSKGAVVEGLKSLRNISLQSTIRTLQHTATGLVPGVTSVLHSLPSAIRDAASVSPYKFVTELSTSLKSDFTVASDAAWGDHLLDVGAHDPAHAASLWQGSHDYPGVDNWENTVARPGQIFEMGAGGPASHFVLDGGSAASVGNDLDLVWGGAQVGDTGHGLRAEMFQLQTTTEVPIAHSVVDANSHYGLGGLHQSYFPDISASLKNGDVVVISRATGLPVPVSWEPVKNSAGEIIDMKPWIDWKVGSPDTIKLHTDVGTLTGSHDLPVPLSVARVGIRLGDMRAGDLDHNLVGAR